MPRRGIMPQWFLLILFFWHDFLIFGTIFGPNFSFWRAINHYQQRSYKVPQYRRHKSLVPKGLRRGDRGFVDVSAYGVRVYGLKSRLSHFSLRCAAIEVALSLHFSQGPPVFPKCQPQSFFTKTCDLSFFSTYPSPIFILISPSIPR